MSMITMLLIAWGVLTVALILLLTVTVQHPNPAHEDAINSSWMRRVPTCERNRKISSFA